MTEVISCYYRHSLLQTPNFGPKGVRSIIARVYCNNFVSKLQQERCLTWGLKDGRRERKNRENGLLSSICILCLKEKKVRTINSKEPPRMKKNIHFRIDTS